MKESWGMEGLTDTAVSGWWGGYFWVSSAGFAEGGGKEAGSSFRNMSGLSDASPISKAAALVAAGGW